METNVVFAHERLIAYQRACEFLGCAAGLLRGLPRGESHLADQLRRAGDSVLLNIAEGAGRTAGREKAHHYDIAAGSATESAAILAVFAIRRLASAPDLARTRNLLHEIVCLLSALARSARARAR